MTSDQELTVTVIGPGNWGTSLISALKAAGVSLPEVIGGRSKPMHRARLGAKVLWLCVPDRAIAPAAHSLLLRAAVLGTDLGQKIVIHSSGALDSRPLDGIARAGASVGSVHPVMSFPTRRVVSLHGVPFGIEADHASRRLLRGLVKTIGGRPFAIASAHKALYHAAGMLASPLLVSHLVAAQQVAALAGFSPRQAKALLEPMAHASVDNFFSRGGAKSFSGPIARGDVATIRLHLQSLQSHPMLAALYRSLAEYAVESLPSQAGKELRKLLRADSKSLRA